MFENIEAVGFDLDGTFLNTHVDYDRINRADRNACLAHGVPFDELEFKTIKRLRAPIREWLVSHGREDEFETICKEIDAELTSTELQFIDEAKPFPGSLECTALLKSKGLKIGLLTRGSHRYAVEALTLMNVIDRFDAVVGRDDLDYDLAKPSPKAMCHFSEALGIRPSNLLYLGDNVTDFYSARDAGAHFVGVASGAVSKERWLKEDPDMIVIDYAGDVVDLI